MSIGGLPKLGLSLLYAHGNCLNFVNIVKMAKVLGLQLVKPRFDWDCRDKLTEIEQFKADCKIIFDGPLLELKNKQRARLIVNWLGREAT